MHSNIFAYVPESLLNKNQIIEINKMKKLSLSVLSTTLSATLAVFAAGYVSADQTSHVYGIHDRSSSHYAFTHATVLVEPGKQIKNATLVIENGQIISVTENGKIPAGATEIDLKSHFIYPGFIDAYSNYVFADDKPAEPHSRSQSPKYHGDRKGGNAWNDAIHAEMEWVNEFKPNKKAAEAYVKNGFTAVQTAKLDGIFQGQGFTVSLADGLPNDLIYKANASHFGAFDKGSSKQAYPSSLMGSIALIRQTLSDADWYQNAKGKTDNLITGQPVEFNAALESLTELKQTGLVFTADDYLSTLRADKLFDQFGIQSSFVADGFEYVRIDEIKNTNATFILPLNYPAKPDVSSFESQLDSSLGELRHWERAPANAAVLAKNNIPFAFTQFGLKKTDELWDKIKISIKHGLSEKDALAALTTVPAKLAGVSEIAGQLKPGMFANMVITDGNIFEEGKIKSVWMSGIETAFSPINPTSFAGNYQFKIANENLSLELTEEDNKVSGYLIKADTGSVESEETKTDKDNRDKKSAEKVAIKVTEQTDNNLLFNADLSTLDLNGVYRFSLRLNENQMTGLVLNDKSERLTFSSQREIQKQKTEEQKKKSEEPISYVGEQTLPNRAFGLNERIKQQNLHIKNATLWTSEKEGILNNSDVIIRDGKIFKIGKELKTPKGYQVIDATGKHISAGIIDEHSHIAISKGVNEGSDAITSEVNIGDVVDPDDINIYRALAGGTTSAQLLHGSANPVGGQAQVIKLRWGTSAEEMKNKLAPGSIKFALGENVKQSNWGDSNTIRYPQTRMGVETIVRDAFTRAKEYKASWKKYADLSRSEKKLISPPRKDFRLEALLEIIEKKRFVHSHSYVASEILSLMNIAEDFDFNIQTFTHILEGYKVADEMVKHGASASTFADWWAYKFEVLDAIPMNTCLMMERGVNVSVNSDSGDLIRRLNTEAAKSVQYCGMSQENAMKMVTINPAIQLKIDGSTGSLKIGKDADFVIWSGNPLSIYSQVEQTWVDGFNYFNREQDQIRRVLIADEKNRLIQKILSEENGAKSGDKNKDEVELSKAVSHKKPSELTDDIYILKEDAAWHCDDDFDFWSWKSAQQGAQF